MIPKSLLLYVMVAIVLLRHFSEAQPQLAENPLQCFGCHEYLIYIFASPVETCPSKVCLTFDQFATNTSQYLKDDTILVFQREQHSLVSQLTVISVTRFALIAETVSNNSGSDVNIVCSENFIFESVSEVYIKGVLFVNCTQNVNNVDQITLDNCTFDGQSQNGAVFHVSNSTASFTYCRFMCTPGLFETSHYNRYYQVCAIFSTHSDISILKSVFEKNGPGNGVAIQVMEESELFVTDTSFTAIAANGSDYADDGFFIAVSASGGSSVSINYSTFNLSRSGWLVHNSYYFSALGTLNSHKSNLSVHGCNYSNKFGSRFIVGKESNISVSKTMIKSSYLMYGLIWAYRGNVHISNCMIRNNHFYGALIGLDSITQLTLQNSNITDNAIVEGYSYSIIHIFDCSNYSLSANRFERNNVSLVWL